MPYLSLTHRAFDRPIALRDAYKLFYAFLVRYNERGGASTTDLLTDMGPLPDGSTADPAQLYDFARLAGEALDDPELLQASTSR